MDHSHLTLYPVTHDNLRLFCRVFPAQQRAKRVVVFTHGLSENGRQYHDFIRYLNKDSIVVVSDLRGHGYSEGRRAYVRSFSDFSDDLQRVVDQISSQNFSSDGHLPVYLAGHSMGGLITVYSILKHHDWAADCHGVILSAPALAVQGPPPWLNQLLVQASRYLGPLAVPRFLNPERVTQDTSKQRIMLDDHLRNRILTLALYREIVAAGTFCSQTQLSKFPVDNVLLLFGDSDWVIDRHRTNRILEGLKIANLQKTTLANCRHDILNEHCREQAYQRIESFLDECENKKFMTSNGFAAA